jgi:hypothetical protein
MAEYRAQSIGEATVSSDNIVRVSFTTGSEPVTIAMEAPLATQLFDKLAAVSGNAPRVKTVRPGRGRRVKSIFNRIGIALGGLCLLPAIYGFWIWLGVSVVEGGWGLIAAFLFAAPVVWGAIFSIGWIIAAFLGDGDKTTA